MSASLARYSQLLLQDLRRDLILISKKTESCRLSMVALRISHWKAQILKSLLPIHKSQPCFTVLLTCKKYNLKKKKKPLTHEAPLSGMEQSTILHKHQPKGACWRSMGNGCGERERERDPRVATSLFPLPPSSVKSETSTGGGRERSLPS